jgi:hypothetical protein
MVGDDLRIEAFCKTVSKAAKDFGVEMVNRGNSGTFLKTTNYPPEFRAAWNKDGECQLFVVYNFSL